MTIYRTSDGVQYHARDAAHLVRQLRQNSFVTTRDDAAFMREYAARVSLQDHNVTIPTGDVEKFVAALISARMITKETKRDYDHEQHD